MKSLAIVALVALTVSPAFAQTILIKQTARAASCPAGKITCYQWCRRYNSSSTTCLTGHPNACNTKVGGNNACVFDRPRS